MDNGHEQSGSQGCDICEKWFYKALDKTKHGRKYSGEKPFQCENCGESYKCKSSVTKHAMTCGNGFKSRPSKQEILKPPEEEEVKMEQIISILTIYPFLVLISTQRNDALLQLNKFVLYKLCAGLLRLKTIILLFLNHAVTQPICA